MSCIHLESCISPVFPGTKLCINASDSPAVKSLLRSMKALEWGTRMLTEELSAFWHFWILKEKKKKTTRQSWDSRDQNKRTEEKKQKQIKRMNNLPVGEITDSGHIWNGDSKDVWNHVSVEAVGALYTLGTVMNSVLTQREKQKSFVSWPS